MKNCNLNFCCECLRLTPVLTPIILWIAHYLYYFVFDHWQKKYVKIRKTPGNSRFSGVFLGTPGAIRTHGLQSRSLIDNLQKILVIQGFLRCARYV